MQDFLSLDKQALLAKKEALQQEYRRFQARGLNLNMARGKPGFDQTDLSVGLLDTVSSSTDYKAADGTDCRNYGVLEGLPELRALFGQVLGVDASQVFVGGNSSLAMMFDTISCMMSHGVGGCEPWSKQSGIKFLCPVPGYDRHFAITEYFGIEMIPVHTSVSGPDMDEVEALVSSDEKIKGIWCVPKYSNPLGITYSDETVRRFAALRPAAKDFRIIWDNAYCIHDISDTPDHLLNLAEECEKTGNQDIYIQFCSTSKITFPGAGVAALATSPLNMAAIKRQYSFQTIGFDKINQLRHVRFFKDYDGLLRHMQLHKAILKPKFEAVLQTLEQHLGGSGIVSWTKPNGGYFISVNVLSGCAKRVVALCKEAGVTLTEAGATYPLGQDPNDSNIRLAPPSPPVAEVLQAMELFCICVQLAAVEKLLSSNG